MTPPLDPHASKISPNDPRLKPRLSRVRYLQKGPALIVLAVVVVAVAVSVTFAVEPRARRTGNEATTFDVTPRLPSEILDAPDVVPPKAAVDAGSPALPAPAPLYDIPTSTPLRASRSGDERRKQRGVDDYLKARGADMFVQTRELPTAPADREGHAEAEDDAPTDSRVQQRLQQARRAVAELAPTEPSSSDFRATAVDRGDGYLHTRLQRPRSPFELKAGTVIPAVLQTAINSDLAGPVFAKVRENVYDSISHENIVIPQNSTLIAAYDSRIAWGQQRVLLCWQRLIFPDGTSLQLECMPGADLTGAAGLTDEVDEHWWRLLKGAAIASLLSAGVAAAGGNTTGYNPTVGQQFVRGAASEFGRAGELVTRRELQVQPTITIRPGWSLNVLVTQDMILEPYPIDMPATDGDSAG
jgi:type IV secretion system protein VirB10